MSFKLGLENLLENKKLLAYLRTKRVALLGHPASVNRDLVSSVDLLSNELGGNLSALFGPQHGMRGDKQYNMIETHDDIDTVLQIPVFSLYGKVRRPTPEMMETFDVILVDLQDLGCRIYTFITTLLYLLEECSRYGKEIFVLDRPNPAGRAVEGLRLEPGHESFVGAGPLPMRHGLTLGEMAAWFQWKFEIDVELTIIQMSDYEINAAPGYGWPTNELAWVNPSPNAANLNMARCYAGSVMLEGTTLSEGRGTTRPLELIGSPDLDPPKLRTKLDEVAPGWDQGCRVRELAFEPTFYKHVGEMCRGYQIHTDGPFYNPDKFKPYRMFALFLKAIRLLNPEYPLWRDFAYEYVIDRLAIDVINGGNRLRKWVDDPCTTMMDFEKILKDDELLWLKERKMFLKY